jgi:hypothetical protein
VIVRMRDEERKELERREREEKRLHSSGFGREKDDRETSSASCTEVHVTKHVLFNGTDRPAAMCDHMNMLTRTQAPRAGCLM